MKFAHLCTFLARFLISERLGTTVPTIGPSVARSEVVEHGGEHSQITEFPPGTECCINTPLSPRVSLSTPQSKQLLLVTIFIPRGSASTEHPRFLGISG